MNTMSPAREAIGFVRKHFLKVSILTITPWILAFGALFLIGRIIRLTMEPDPSGQFDPVQLWSSMSALQKAGIFLAYFVTLSVPRAFGKAAITLLVQKPSLSAGEVIHLIVSHILTVTMLALFNAVLLAACLFTLFLPLLIVFGVAAFAVPSAVTENLGVLASLRRSRELSREVWGKLVGMHLLYDLIGTLLVMGASVLGVIDWIVAMVAVFVIASLITALTHATVGFYHQRLVRPAAAAQSAS
jgi:hypothetical protein